MDDARSRRVGLVIPPSPFLLDERVFVSLGLLKVAAALEQAGHTVSVVDLSGVRDCTQQYLATSRDDTVGFTITTPQLPSALELARLARALRPDIRLIAGGPHITLTHSAAKLEHRLRRSAAGRANTAMATLQKAFDVLRRRRRSRCAPRDRPGQSGHH